ncbi:MAG: extracellular solute-binding protein [Alphaproteobacteria bacterium]|nr:extracellular solute-binding protein [Alphaproteobacteria bacterium]
MLNKIFLIFTVLVSFTTVTAATAEENTLNIYSSRHYDTDEKLYSDFTDQTGIKINRVDGKDDALIARLEQEGNLSPADLFITVDSGRLWRAEQAGLFQAIQSEVLKEKIPANLQNPEGQWFGFSTRARILVYNKNKIEEGALNSYQDLADPKWKGRICVRSSGNIYNQSLLASMIAQDGEDVAKAWAKGVQDNLARKPQGGDTDQIKAVAAGVCDIALANSYYLFRLQRSETEEDKAIVENLAIVFPNQDNTGTHVNISGAGVLKNAKNKDAAVKFLEYLTSETAQAYFANGNNEYPVVEGVEVNEVVETNKNFKIQDINVREFGKHQKQAKMIFDEIEFP